MALGSNCSGFCYKEAGKKSFKNIIFLCIIKLFYLFRNLKKKKTSEPNCMPTNWKTTVCVQSREMRQNE